jgi:hypothetical protein
MLIPVAACKSSEDLHCSAAVRFGFSFSPRAKEKQSKIVKIPGYLRMLSSQALSSIANALRYNGSASSARPLATRNSARPLSDVSQVENFGIAESTKIDSKVRRR